mgnify:FL=1|tara:strand:- start:484 stop:1209 length:726 start_codon:yes stop_codon:yes gene_type:complete
MDITQPIIHDRHIVKQAMEQLIQNGPVQFEKPDNLTIATCRNEGTLADRIIPHLSGYEEQSILERNMEYLGMDLVVLRDSRLPWRNTFKFEMLNNYLKDCPTEYFMCLDAIDVIWVDEPQRVMDIFKSFDCEALFMSTHSTDGYNCMPNVEQWVNTINVSGRYLNSGVYIGKTSFIKEMVEEAMKYAIPHGVTMDDYREYLSSQPEDYPKGSQDQDIFRFIEPKFYPRVKVDYENKMAFRS